MKSTTAQTTLAEGQKPAFFAVKYRRYHSDGWSYELFRQRDNAYGFCADKRADGPDADAAVIPLYSSAPTLPTDIEAAVKEIREPKRRQLVHSARVMFDTRLAKYNDPRNLEWDFDDVTDKWQRHAYSAYLDLLDTEAVRDALCHELEATLQILALYPDDQILAIQADGIRNAIAFANGQQPKSALRGHNRVDGVERGLPNDLNNPNAKFCSRCTDKSGEVVFHLPPVSDSESSSTSIQHDHRTEFANCPACQALGRVEEDTTVLPDVSEVEVAREIALNALIAQNPRVALYRQQDPTFREDDVKFWAEVIRKAKESTWNEATQMLRESRLGKGDQQNSDSGSEG